MSLQDDYPGWGVTDEDYDRAMRNRGIHCGMCGKDVSHEISALTGLGIACMDCNLVSQQPLRRYR